MKIIACFQENYNLLDAWVSMFAKDYMEVDGFYNGEENKSAVIMLNSNASTSLLNNYCKTFKQDSVLVIEGDACHIHKSGEFRREYIGKMVIK